jgi:hypothetical protein
VIAAGAARRAGGVRTRAARFALPVPMTTCRPADVRRPHASRPARAPRHSNPARLVVPNRCRRAVRSQGRGISSACNAEIFPPAWRQGRDDTGASIRAAPPDRSWPERLVVANSRPSSFRTAGEESRALAKPRSLAFARDDGAVRWRPAHSLSFRTAGEESRALAKPRSLAFARDDGAVRWRPAHSLSFRTAGEESRALAKPRSLPRLKAGVGMTGLPRLKAGVGMTGLCDGDAPTRRHSEPQARNLSRCGGRNRCPGAGRWSGRRNRQSQRRDGHAQPRRHEVG